MYSKVTYLENEASLYYLSFEYDSNLRLIGVNHYKEDTLIKQLQIEYKDNYIIVKDESSKDYVKCIIEEKKIVSIEQTINNCEESLNKIDIEYYDKKTIIINDGRKSFIYFDEYDFPLYEIDEEGNVVETRYDNNSKKLLYQSSVISTKNKDSDTRVLDIKDFINENGLIITNTTISDTDISSVVGQVYNIRGTGKLTYTINEAGFGGENIGIVLFGKQKESYNNTSYVEKILETDKSKTKVFKKENIDNKFEIISLGLSTINSYSSIKITLNFVGDTEIELGEIQLIKKIIGTTYTYDSNGNMISTNRGSNNASNTYNSSGLVTSTTRNDSITNYEYDTKCNVISAKTAYGSKIKYSYDKYNNIKKEVVSTSNSTKMLETTKEYDTTGKFMIGQTDELRYKTSYAYDSFGKITKITNALNEVSTYEYDAFDNLIKLISADLNKLEFKYSSTDNKMLEQIIIPNGSVYTFKYDACRNINKVLLNEEEIVSYEYDLKTNLIKKQEYPNGDHIEFIYNDKYNIESIKINGVYKYGYEYDKRDRLSYSYDCNTGSDIRSFEYDNEGRNKKYTYAECLDIKYDYDKTGNIIKKENKND